MDTLSTQEPDSPEFTGLARRLNDRLAAAAVISSPMMAAIRKDIIATGERRGKRRTPRIAWRPDYLLEIEQRWRRIPDTERLYLHIERTKTSLTIIDVRVGSTVLTNSNWADGQQETDLMIVGNRVVLNAHGSECANAPMSTVSVRHALSRRYRRGFSNTDAAVMADLAVLAKYQMPDVPTLRVVVQAPSGGEWRGDVTRFNSVDGAENLVLGIRTFV